MKQAALVGKKLKSLRQESNLTLRELSCKAGVSTTQISEIERNQTSPTVTTLMKLIAALGQETSIFFDDGIAKKVALVREDERQIIIDQKNQVHIESLTTGIVDSKLKVIITRPKPGHVNIPGGYQHPGEELIYVIKGQIEVKVGAKKHVLSQGDSIHFRGELRHSVKNITSGEVELIAIISPPNY